MAASPDPDTMHSQGPLGSNFITADYTDAETAIRQTAEKRMGVKSVEVSSKGSEEMRDVVNTQSPVAAPKRNRYGV